MGVSADPRPLAAGVRRGGLGSEARDVPPTARAAFREIDGVPRVVRHENLKAAVVRASMTPIATTCIWPSPRTAAYATADAAAHPTRECEAGAEWRLCQIQRAEGPALRQPRRAECSSGTDARSGRACRRLNTRACACATTRATSERICCNCCWVRGRLEAVAGGAVRRRCPNRRTMVSASRGTARVVAISFQ